MTKKIAINGFGRLGRCIARVALSHKNCEIVGINDIANKENLAYLFQFDSTHGKLLNSNKTEIKVSINKAMEEAQSARVKNSPADYIVLAIDDSNTDRAIMKKCLKPLGVTILEAADGLEGLEIVKNSDKPIDAVLVDIEMPRMDGYTFASEVRKYNKFKNLPLIAVTSRTSKTDRMRGVESGMTEYITKPYTPEYLVNVIKRNIHLVTGE